MFKWCNCQPSQLPGAKQTGLLSPSSSGWTWVQGFPKRTLFGFQPEKCEASSIPLKHLLHHTWQNVAPDIKKTVLQTVEILVMEAHGCWWPTQCSGGAPPFAYGIALALRLTETSLQSVELSEKDSSVTTFFNLNLQVKRNINCLFMSSPPTADWCRIQLKVALKCKVGVIICLKYFGSF